MSNEENRKSQSKIINLLFGDDLIDFDKSTPKLPLLQHDMDEQTKERYRIVNEFENSYLEKFMPFKKTENQDLIREKIKDFRKTVSKKMYEKCQKEYQELNKHLEYMRIDESLYNLPLFSENEEYNIAHQNFINCSSFERNLITRLDDKIRFLAYVYDFQYSLCKKNCIESKFYGVKEDYENCILQCLKYTQKNVEPSIEGILEQLVDDYSHILDHLVSKDPKY